MFHLNVKLSYVVHPSVIHFFVVAAITNHHHYNLSESYKQLFHNSTVTALLLPLPAVGWFNPARWPGLFRRRLSPDLKRVVKEPAAVTVSDCSDAHQNSFILVFTEYELQRFE